MDMEVECMDINMCMKWLVTVTNHRLSNTVLNITDRYKSPLQHYSVLYTPQSIQVGYKQSTGGWETGIYPIYTYNQPNKHKMHTIKKPTKPFNQTQIKQPSQKPHIQTNLNQMHCTQLHAQMQMQHITKSKWLALIHRETP